MPPTLNARDPHTCNLLQEPSLGYEFWPLYVAAVNKGVCPSPDTMHCCCYFQFMFSREAASCSQYDEDRDRVLQDDTKDEERKQELLAEVTVCAVCSSPIHSLLQYMAHHFQCQVERGREQSMQGLQFEKHEELRAQGRKRLSFRATQVLFRLCAA